MVERVPFKSSLKENEYKQTSPKPRCCFRIWRWFIVEGEAYARRKPSRLRPSQLPDSVTLSNGGAGVKRGDGWESAERIELKNLAAIPRFQELCETNSVIPRFQHILSHTNVL